jgi:hypothetical protein
VSTGVPRYARPFVAAFLALVVICALAPLNLWPFSNWELFSRLRTPQVTSWEAVAIGRSGGEHHYPLAPVRVADRERLCATWLREGNRIIRVYRLERLLSHRAGRHAAPANETLAWLCTAKGVREAS